MKENGVVLMSFYALIICLSIMNTYFEKCDVYKYNWKHHGGI